MQFTKPKKDEPVWPWRIALSIVSRYAEKTKDGHSVAKLQEYHFPRIKTECVAASYKGAKRGDEEIIFHNCLPSLVGAVNYLIAYLRDEQRLEIDKSQLFAYSREAPIIPANVTIADYLAQEGQEDSRPPNNGICYSNIPLSDFSYLSAYIFPAGYKPFDPALIKHRLSKGSRSVVLLDTKKNGAPLTAEIKSTEANIVLPKDLWQERACWFSSNDAHLRGIAANPDWGVLPRWEGYLKQEPNDKPESKAERKNKKNKPKTDEPDNGELA